MSRPAREPLVRVWLEDAAYALRALAATPRYSLPALASLALGIGASTAIFAIFSALMLRPLPFPREEELVDVGLRGATQGDAMGALSVTYAAEFKGLRTIFASLAAYTDGVVTVTGRGDARRAVAAKVTPEFFDTLAIDAEAGRTFSARGDARDGADVVVLSHRYWLSAFGAESVLGQTIAIDGEPKTILGIVADERSLPAQADLWVPARFTDEEKDSRFQVFLGGVGRLAPGVSLEVAEERLRVETERQGYRVPDGRLVSGALSPLREKLVGETRATVSLMLAAVGAFLLLACANVASLLVTRASVRGRELAVRAALGASPAALARQSSLEALLLALVGSAAGLVLASALVGGANRTYSAALAYTPARLDARVLAAFLGLTIASAVGVGVAPALHAIRVRPMDSLRADGRTSSTRGARRLRELLVALQVAATVVLLGSAAVLARSVRAMHAVDPGFDRQAVTARVLYPPSHKDDLARTRAFARAVAERAAHLPGVTAAAIASDLPFDGTSPNLGIALEPGAPNQIGYAEIHLVSPGYFHALGIPRLSGRDFVEGDLPPDPTASGVRVAIVNRAFATQHFGTVRVVGHKFRPTTEAAAEAKLWYEVVGVVEDTLEVAVGRAVLPAAYFPFTTEFSFWGSGFAVVVRGDGDPSALLEALPKVTREINRDAPLYDVDVVGAMVERSYKDRTSLELVLGAFALASIALAAIGLFGVTSYTVAERSGEIGIRRALGANRGDIARMILGETGAVVGLGIAAGLACAWGARALLASFLVGVSAGPAGDMATYAVVVWGIASVALLAALAPVRAAARVTPARALEVR